MELSNPKGSTVEYANAVVPQQDAIHRCPALIVLKEENNNNNKWFLKMFSDDEQTTSLSSLFHVLMTLSLKKCWRRSVLTRFLFSFNGCPLVLSCVVYSKNVLNLTVDNPCIILKTSMRRSDLCDKPMQPAEICFRRMLISQMNCTQM